MLSPEGLITTLRRTSATKTSSKSPAIALLESETLVRHEPLVATGPSLRSVQEIAIDSPAIAELGTVIDATTRSAAGGKVTTTGPIAAETLFASPAAASATCASASITMKLKNCVAVAGATSANSSVRSAPTASGPLTSTRGARNTSLPNTASTERNTLSLQLPVAGALPLLRMVQRTMYGWLVTSDNGASTATNTRSGAGLACTAMLPITATLSVSLDSNRALVASSCNSAL